MAKNHFVMIRVNPEEKARLEKLAEIDGCSTLTQFCRRKLFQSLSTEMKLNQIIDLLNSKGGKKKSDNGTKE